MNYLFLLAPILTATTAQIFLKKGMLKIGHLDISFANIFSLIARIFKNIWLIAGIIFFGMSFLSYLFVLSNWQLSIVYPVIVSAGITIISFLSRIFFKETLARAQILGIIIIIFGIFILVR
ncbi:MAG: hypothetical protein A2654_02165 [Candidatus Nealsonbacteria bacterium RIFCSPHIGHO2_01_FULL_43_31]|uniref:EamA domain-containing protein n=1 Tax=Candidatus Nealsonbacteria bacterium RIFCSPHIGHO2_01_FULL_43_31 TaxID=1801665 RepID=A0A1G2E2U4_9BACT|nr:MAG: hypothetical protein A2654_02165 [Candidatus Nealsonbacteria bacterium RIFCSPHIGHO2_01_FULL_43_31]OGZ24963.1 MAG: hypothetical protein A2922_02535 [Candidatus Nealsonbacteria bacterium RIFCSPLOWO2_01_FULL_43_36]